ncbi:putative non-specific serine/threonine protein kinase [Helianthus debilis subsp. tardiflorus]
MFLVSISHPFLFSIFLTMILTLQYIFSVTSLVSLDLTQCHFHGPIPSFRNLTSLELLHAAVTNFMNSSSIFQELSSRDEQNGPGTGTEPVPNRYRYRIYRTGYLFGTDSVPTFDIFGTGSVPVRYGTGSDRYFARFYPQIPVPNRYRYRTVPNRVYSVPVPVPTFEDFRYRFFRYRYPFGTEPDRAHPYFLDSLQNLTNLISLRLTRNQLTKRIPKSLGNFCNLREFDLSANNIGNISLTYLLESFFECKSPALESLSLSNNYIAGIIPHSIGNLSFLRTLYLIDNQIYGPIPYSIGRLSSLEVLDVSYNRLDGSLPDSLGQLSKLTLLYFSNNLLTGVVTEAHFIKLVSLKYLIASTNKLILRLQVANWIPPFQLRYLSLRNWVLGPQFPLWLPSQKDLVILDISNTGISSPMPESFVRSFSNLYYLNMSNNHIRGPLTFFGIPATLDIIDISSNGFGGSLHPFLCSSGATKTYFLNLENNHLSGDIPDCWEKWPRLETLNLRNNSLSGEIPRTLGSLPLQYINMRGNKISGRLHSSLMNLTELDVLELGRNELTGSIPTWIGSKLNFLRILNLRSNRFDGNIPHQLCHIRRIQILDLAHNNLSGNIPRCFNNFSILSGIENNYGDYFPYAGIGGPEQAIAGDSLVTKGREDTYSSILPLVMLIDLSSNNLTGHIPSELMSLLELTSLKLSRNQLSGSIPEKIGNMKELISLDLSVNRLSGELP